MEKIPKPLRVLFFSCVGLAFLVFIAYERGVSREISICNATPLEIWPQIGILDKTNDDEQGVEKVVGIWDQPIKAGSCAKIEYRNRGFEKNSKLAVSGYSEDEILKEIYGDKAGQKYFFGSEFIIGDISEVPVGHKSAIPNWSEMRKKISYFSTRRTFQLMDRVDKYPICVMPEKVSKNCSWIDKKSESSLVNKDSKKSENKHVWKYGGVKMSGDYGKAFWAALDGSCSSLPRSFYENVCLTEETFYFDIVEMEDADEYTYAFFIPETISRGGRFDKNDLESELQNARQLLQSIKENLYISSKFPSDFNWPYILGAYFSDPNGHLRPGIEIEHTFESGPAFDIGLESSDIVLFAAGKYIYSINDLNYALFIHGKIKGIEEPFPIVIQRGGEVLFASSGFMFNERHYGRSAADANTAAGYGFLDAAAVGAEITLICTSKETVERGCKGVGWVARQVGLDASNAPSCPEFDFDKCRFDNIQEMARLQQMYPEKFRGGGVAGMFVPTTRVMALGKITGANKLAKKVKLPRLGGVPKAVAAEALDTVIWETLRASPGTTAKEISSAIKDELPYAAGIGFGLGVWELRSKSSKRRRK